MDSAFQNAGIIKKEASRLGFDACGISSVKPLPEDAARLESWLQNGFHAGMSYMERNLDKRVDPAKLVEGAKSVISVLLNYYPSRQQKDPDAPVVSKYAYGKDYHQVLKDKLHLLLECIMRIIPGTTGRVFVDSAPVLEHAWARNSGLGWIGKNSLLLTTKLGSYVFIGELIVDAELSNDEPVNELCGSCRACIDSCPTGAIVSEGVVDAGRCISFHTIENKTDIMPVELKDKFLNRAFGCDICQDVCPWNRKIASHKTPEFEPEEEFLLMDKKSWINLNKEKYNRLFTGTPLERAGYEGMKRNIRFIKD